MTKKKKPFSIVLLVKRAIVLTLIIGVIQTLIIYLYFTKEEEENVVAEKSQLQPAEVANQDSSAANLPTPAVSYKPAVKDSSTTSPVIENKVVSNPNTDTIITAQKKAPKVMNESMMKDVVDRLQAKGSSKCVKVRLSESSNVTNGFKIAGYLKANGYIISGRETTSKNVKGINITPSGDCMVITIGTL